MSFGALFVGCAVICFVQAAAINEDPKTPPTNPPAALEKVNDFFNYDSESNLRPEIEDIVTNFDRNVTQEYYNILNETAKNAQSLDLEKLSKLGKQDFDQTNNERLGESVVSKNVNSNEELGSIKFEKPKINMSQEMFIQISPELSIPPKETENVENIKDEVKKKLEDFLQQFDFKKEEADVDLQEMKNSNHYFDEDMFLKTETDKFEDDGVRVINDEDKLFNFENEGVQKIDENENKEINSENENKEMNTENLENNNDLYIIKQRPDRLYPSFIFKNTDLNENGIFSDLLDNNFNNYKSSIKNKYQDLYDEDDDVNNTQKDLNSENIGEVDLMDDDFLQSIISNEADEKIDDFSLPASKFFSTPIDVKELNNSTDLNEKLVTGGNATDFYENFTFDEDFADNFENLNNTTVIEKQIDSNHDGKVDEVLLNFLSTANNDDVQNAPFKVDLNVNADKDLDKEINENVEELGGNAKNDSTDGDELLAKLVDGGKINAAKEIIKELDQGIKPVESGNDKVVQ